MLAAWARISTPQPQQLLPVQPSHLAVKTPPATNHASLRLKRLRHQPRDL
jgi:hypothetical protein